MPTVSGVRLRYTGPLAQAPELMVEQQARVLKAVADIIKKKIDIALPHEQAYKDSLAGPSSSAYSPVINPAFKSRSGRNRDDIVKSQEQNILDSYEKYLVSIEGAFEEVNGEVAPRFKQSVDAHKEVYSHRVARTTLPFTGAMEIGKGIIGIAAFWLVNDPTVLRHIRANDEVFAGGPLNVARQTPDLRSTLKAALVQRLMQSGRLVVLSDWNPTKMTQENDQNNAVIAGLQDAVYVPFATGGPSHCDWKVIDGKKYLEIQVATP
ncbi:MAG: hypothetical protein AB1599_05425 [Planctomycetota bacterium]